MDPQTQSPLFRLPTEIRTQILTLIVYDGAVSQHVAHFEGARGFVRLPCRPVPDQDVRFRHPLDWFSRNNSPWRGGHLECYRELLPPSSSSSSNSSQNHAVAAAASADPPRFRSPLPLLLACRRLHDEAAAVLYAHLSFVGLKPLRRFLRSRQHGYLDRVRVLEVQWEGIVRSAPSFNLDFADWAPTCDRLARQLANLRRLRVRILVCDRTGERVAGLFLRPLQAVRWQAAEAEVVAEVVRHCWDPHPRAQPKKVTTVVLGDYEVPIRVCNVHLQDRWPGDHVLEQVPNTV